MFRSFIKYREYKPRFKQVDVSDIRTIPSLGFYFVVTYGDRQKNNLQMIYYDSIHGLIKLIFVCKRRWNYKFIYSYSFDCKPRWYLITTSFKFSEYIKKLKSSVKWTTTFQQYVFNYDFCIFYGIFEKVTVPCST